METVLKGLPMVVAYLDDILVVGRTEARTLEESHTSFGTSTFSWNESQKREVWFRVSGTCHL